MSLKSLPPRPLTIQEGDDLAKSPNGIIPDAYIEPIQSNEPSGYVALIHATDASVKVLGYEKNDKGWNVVKEFSADTPVDTTYEYIDEWVSDNFDSGDKR